MLVPTKHGFKNLLDLNPGDILFGTNGEDKIIQFTSPQFTPTKTYLISFSDGASITVPDFYLFPALTHDQRRHAVIQKTFWVTIDAMQPLYYQDRTPNFSVDLVKVPPDFEKWTAEKRLELLKKITDKHGFFLPNGRCIVKKYIKVTDFLLRSLGIKTNLWRKHVSFKSGEVSLRLKRRFISEVKEVKPLATKLIITNNGRDFLATESFIHVSN